MPRNIPTFAVVRAQVEPRAGDQVMLVVGLHEGKILRFSFDAQLALQLSGDLARSYQSTREDAPAFDTDLVEGDV